MPYENPYESRDAALAKLMSLSGNRQRFADEQYAQMLAEKKAAELEAFRQQEEGNRNWMHLAGSGAAMGAQAGGMGAAIGGLIGAGVGIAGSTASRMQGGPGQRKKGFFDALGSAVTRPAGDKWDGLSDVPLSALGSAAGSLAARSPSEPFTST